MFTSKLLTTLYGLRFGEPVAVAEADAEALVLIAGGVGGIDLTSHAMRHVVGQSRGPQLVRSVSWGHGWGRWHADLCNVANQQAGSKVLADQVLAWRARYPDRPVFVVGKSGGTGIAIGAMEALPEGTVEAAFLLAPAMSPRYNLTRSLGAVRREMVVFWSPLDVVILGLGTWLFGTVDRVHTISAGLVGFQVPRGLNQAGQRLYETKLRQVRWTANMVASGNLGGHIGTDNPAFLRKYIVPLLRKDATAAATQPPRQSSPPTTSPIT